MSDGYKGNGFRDEGFEGLLVRMVPKTGRRHLTAVGDANDLGDCFRAG